MSVAVDRDQAFLAAVRHVADEHAAPHADDVDRQARFPVEALDALRAERALSAFVPTELGGGGVSFEAIAAACFELGRRCGSSAMVFAMHQIQAATIVRHLDAAPWFEEYLERLSAEQRLIASVTSEVGTGGDMGRSIAAVTPAEGAAAEGATPAGRPLAEGATPVEGPLAEGATPVEGPPSGGACTFEKQAPTVSYGSYADDLFVTLRRAPEAEQSDQVVALVHREQTALEQTGTWDPLGMRGTCSPGYTVRAAFSSQQVLPTPFPRVMAESLVPITHILWSHLWLGIATDAFDRARAFVRAAAKRNPGETPPVALRLSHVMSELSLLRAEVGSALEEFVAASEDADPTHPTHSRERLLTMASALRFNNLKIAASEQAPRVCQGALGVCGIVGFKNDTPFSVGRHLRDTMSACLMIANERIHQTNASLLLIAKEV